MKNRLIARLAQLAAQQQTISYGALAVELEIQGPGAIAQLTGVLETLIIEDVLANKPVRACLVVGRLNDGLPARGFFETLARCNVSIDCPYVTWIALERQKLFATAELR